MKLGSVFGLVVSVAALGAGADTALAAPTLQKLGTERTLADSTFPQQDMVRAQAVALGKGVGGFMATWVGERFQLVDDKFFKYTYSSYVRFFDINGDQKTSTQMLAEPATSIGTPSINAAPVSFADGNSVVVYSAGSDPGSQDIFTQYFVASGARSGGARRLNQVQTGIQGEVAAARRPDGYVSAIWNRGEYNSQGYRRDVDVRGRLVREYGGINSPERALTKGGSRRQVQAIAALSNNDTAFAFALVSNTGDDPKYYVSRTDSTGALLGTPAFIPVTASIGSGPGLAALPNGRYVAVFASKNSAGEVELIAQFFGADGVPQKSISLGAISPYHDYFVPQLAVEPGSIGRIFILTSEYVAGKYQIIVRAIHPNGNVDFGPASLESGANLDAAYSLVRQTDGSFVAIWSSSDSPSYFDRLHYVRFKIVG